MLTVALAWFMLSKDTPINFQVRKSNSAHFKVDTLPISHDPFSSIQLPVPIQGSFRMSVRGSISRSSLQRL